MEGGIEGGIAFENIQVQSITTCLHHIHIPKLLEMWKEVKESPPWPCSFFEAWGIPHLSHIAGETREGKEEVAIPASFLSLSFSLGGHSWTSPPLPPPPYGPNHRHLHHFIPPPPPSFFTSSSCRKSSIVSILLQRRAIGFHSLPFLLQLGQSRCCSLFLSTLSMLR